MDEPGSITDNLRNKSRFSVNSVSVSKCINCTGSDSLSNCERFLSLSVGQCSILAREKRVCFNCLRSGHLTAKCPNKSRCMHCRRIHHSLYLAVGEITNVTVNRAPGADDSKTQTVLNAFSVLESATVAHVQTARTEVPYTFNVLLAIAWVDLHTVEGRCVRVRALLD
jgi:phosphoribosylformylglycinamidine (FGAM) synthase PurS component